MAADSAEPPTAAATPPPAAPGGGGGGGGLSQLARSMAIAPPASNASPSAPVPDVLLSLAKDDRYVSEVASLLSQVAVSLASVFLLPGGPSTSARTSRAHNNGGVPNGEDVLEDGGQRFIERIRPELNLLASIVVHSATFVFYTRNFGGVAEASGESIQRSLGMESLNLAYRYPERKGNGSSRANNSKVRQLVEKVMRNISSLGLSRWHRLLLLQTVAPYIIHRVGRGGWSKDLGGLVSSILELCGLGPLGARTVGRATSLPENEQPREEDGATPRNDDRLRGSARRRLFEEQRRRMLSSSGASEDDSETLDETNNTTGVRHEPANGHHQNQLARGDAFGRRLQKLSTLTWNVIQRISLAVSTLSHGAHTLPRHISTTATESLDRYAKVIRWFLRLHLALFYWNGAYPTIAHRLVRAKIGDGVAPYSTTDSTTGAIIANRPSYKPLAAMIMVQAVAALAQTTAEASIEVAHFVQVSFFRWRRRRRMQQQVQTGAGSSHDENGPLLDGTTSSERAEYMELIEERVPGLASSNRDTPQSKQNALRKKAKQAGSGSHPCGICLNDRVDPAAPSVCGHVFCWNCILHWVSNVRAECPLCRAKTRPQDILPLCNYP